MLTTLVPGLKLQYFDGSISVYMCYILLSTAIWLNMNSGLKQDLFSFMCHHVMSHCLSGKILWVHACACDGLYVCACIDWYMHIFTCDSIHPFVVFFVWQLAYYLLKQRHSFYYQDPDLIKLVIWGHCHRNFTHSGLFNIVTGAVLESTSKTAYSPNQCMNGRCAYGSQDNVDSTLGYYSLEVFLVCFPRTIHI